MFDYNLSQVIQIPTHTGGNILDIVLTNTPEAVFNVNVAPFWDSVKAGVGWVGKWELIGKSGVG